MPSNHFDKKDKNQIIKMMEKFEEILNKIIVT